jgi:uncharacterized membrane protein
VKSRALDLVAAVALAAGAMTTMLWAQPAPGGLDGALRIFFALPLVLVLPGYALTAALFPGRSLGLAERALFSLGLSLAVAILGGLALHWAPVGLRASSWAVLLGNVTLLGCLVALVRRVRRPAEPAQAGVVFTQTQAVALGLAAVIACGALLVARDGALNRRDPGFTQLWVLPAETQAGAAVQLGVANQEAGIVRYRLQLQAGDEVLSAWPSIVLAPNERWQEVVALPRADREVEAVLYRLDMPQAPYRQVVYQFEQDSN